MKKSITLIIASLVLVAGCQQTRPQPADRVSEIPLIIDEAMQKRDFEQSTIYYPRGTIVDPPFQYDPNATAGQTGGTEFRTNTAAQITSCETEARLQNLPRGFVIAS